MSLGQSAMAMMAGGSVIQAYGAREAAKAEAAIYKYNAEVAMREAHQQNVISLEEQRMGRETMRQTLAKQRARYAKAAVQMAGTPFQVQLKAVSDMAADLAMLGYGRQISAQQLRSRAVTEAFKKESARKAGRIGVFTSLLGGAGDIAKFKLSKELT
jgi:hypothetical protein